MSTVTFPKAKTDQQVIADHVSKSPSGCLIWTGAQNKGYGKLRRHGRTWAAHRFAWTIERGPIPEGLVIDHLCRTPLCVNVQHMEVTSVRVNTLRGISSSATNATKTHCKRGHEFAPGNVYIPPGRRERHCVICKRAYLRAYSRGISIDELFALEQKEVA